MRHLFTKPEFFKLVGYECFSDEVKRFHESNARVKIPTAPARGSKSMSAAYDAAYDVFPPVDEQNRPLRKDFLIWIVATDYKTAKEWDYFWEIFVDNRKKYGFPEPKKAHNSPNQGNMLIEIVWGRTPNGDISRTIIECKSSTNERSLQGEEVHRVLFSEAAEHEEKIWTQYLSTRYGEAYFPTTPKIRAQWLQQMIQLGELDPDLGIESFTFPPWSNPVYNWQRYWDEHKKAESRVTGQILTYPPDELDRMSETNGHNCFKAESHCQAAKDPAFAEQFLGLWTYESERVLPFRWQGEFSHVLETVPDWVQYAPKFVTTDYGYSDPAFAGWFAVGTDGTCVLYRELYQDKLAVDEFVRKIHNMTKAANEQIAYYVGDPQRPEVSAIMRRRGLPVVAMKSKAMRDRAAGHATFVNYLSTDPATGRPKFYVTKACPKSIDEFKFLRRRKMDGNEFATGAYIGADHAYDGCRYFLMTNPRGKPPQTTYDEMESQRRLWLAMQGRRPPEVEGGLIGSMPSRVA
jgi:hypothetical protein